ncbi:hypothetical protein TWF506_001454 [Arthrobotrys conoides]|uniref:Uncharacterized protein n=1 Tax=Arthrobotrys conoides TaxID=74498 RepID=A0AAN8NG55_9PEZI
MRALVLSLLALAIAPTAFADSDKLCIEVPDNFMPGRCSIKMNWNRHYINRPLSKNDTANSPVPSDFYSIKGFFLDGNRKIVSGQGFSWGCSRMLSSTENGCSFASQFLPHEMKVNYDMEERFLQFEYGNLKWHTNPTPDGQNFVNQTHEPRNRGRPWCYDANSWSEVGGKVEGDTETERQLLDISPRSKSEAKKIEKRRVECFFPCDIFIVDTRPGKGSVKKCPKSNIDPPPMPTPIPPVPSLPPVPPIPPVPPVPPVPSLPPTVVEPNTTGTLPTPPPVATVSIIEWQPRIETITISRTRTSSSESGEE